MDNEQIVELLRDFRAMLLVDHRYIKIALDKAEQTNLSKTYDELSDHIDHAYVLNLRIHDMVIPRFSSYARDIEELLNYNDFLHSMFHVLENVDDIENLSEDELVDYNTAVQNYDMQRQVALNALTRLSQQFIG